MLKDRTSRHLAFWRREPVDRPVLGVYLGGYLSEDIYLVAKDGDLLHPDQLRPELFFTTLSKQLNLLNDLDQDLIVPVQPISSVPWLEAMFGCPILVSAHSIWAGKLLEKNSPIESFKPAWDEAWEEAALHFVQALVRQFSPDAPIAGPFLRGPADVLAALIGAERLAYELIDHPADIQRLAALCAQRWVGVTQRILAEIPAWMDGYVLGARWLYAPASCSYASEDITMLFSPDTYRNIFLPHNEWMTEQVPYGFWHRHSPSWHHLKALSGLPPTWAVEVTMDPGGARSQKILPILKELQNSGRCLIIFGLNDPVEVETLVSNLSPRGLCLTVQADHPEQASRLLEAVRECVYGPEIL